MMPPDKAAIAKIHRLLHQLGLVTNYTGFFHTAYAIHLAMEEPRRLILVTKWLYPEVAQHYRTSWHAVERNIRTAITLIWNTNAPLLETIAGYPLPGKPGPAQFIAIMAAYLSDERRADEQSL